MVLNNIHPKKSDFDIEVVIEGQDIVLRAVYKEKKKRTEYNSFEIMRFYLGEHMIKDAMFSGENNENLRNLIGQVVRRVIIAATESGYSMALRDVQKAIGI